MKRNLNIYLCLCSNRSSVNKGRDQYDGCDLVGLPGGVDRGLGGRGGGLQLRGAAVPVSRGGPAH